MDIVYACSFGVEGYGIAAPINQVIHYAKVVFLGYKCSFQDVWINSESRPKISFNLNIIRKTRMYTLMNGEVAWWKNLWEEQFRIFCL